METLRARIDALLDFQDDRGLDVEFDGLTLDPRGKQPKPAFFTVFERIIKSNGPIYEVSLSPPMYNSRPQRRILYETFLPTSPLSSDYSDREFPFPPAAPDVPQSPSSTTFSSLSSGSSGSISHWASQIFDGRHSVTPFTTSGQTFVHLSE